MAVRRPLATSVLILQKRSSVISDEGIGESIRVRSLKDSPARCKRALEPVLDGPQSVLCQFRSPVHPPAGPIGASLLLNCWAIISAGRSTARPVPRPVVPGRCPRSEFRRYRGRDGRSVRTPAVWVRRCALRPAVAHVDSA